MDEVELVSLTFGPSEGGPEPEPEPTPELDFTQMISFLIVMMMMSVVVSMMD